SLVALIDFLVEDPRRGHGGGLSPTERSASESVAPRGAAPPCLVTCVTNLTYVAAVGEFSPAWRKIRQGLSRVSCCSWGIFPSVAENPPPRSSRLASRRPPRTPSAWLSIAGGVKECSRTVPC